MLPRDGDKIVNELAFLRLIQSLPSAVWVILAAGRLMIYLDIPHYSIS